jgi:hypothetical protein
MHGEAARGWACARFGVNCATLILTVPENARVARKRRVFSVRISSESRNHGIRERLRVASARGSESRAREAPSREREKEGTRSALAYGGNRASAYYCIQDCIGRGSMLCLRSTSFGSNYFFSVHPAVPRKVISCIGNDTKVANPRNSQPKDRRETNSPPFIPFPSLVLAQVLTHTFRRSPRRRRRRRRVSTA